MFQSYSPTTRWDDLGQPGDMAEIHDISIPAQSHQRLRAPSQEQLTKTGPDTSQPRSPAQRTRTPPRKEPHRPGAQGCNAEDDNPRATEGSGKTSNCPSAHFSQCTRAEKGGWKSPPSTTSLTIYKIVTFHLLSPTGEHDTDTQQDRPRRACTITTGSERVFCGTYNEPVTEEDASFKKLSLQNPSVTIVLSAPHHAHSTRREGPQ
ncbi:hypothetical protein F2P79_024930 [Pimephales promelas]|nr:hypothetical protein F2P79_024930 [Pimephales promelas]